MLLRRRFMVGIKGAELVRWLALREGLPPDDAAGAIRCRLADEESRSVMEKERRGREAWSGPSVEGRRWAASSELVLVAGGGGAASVLAEKTAVMLSGVPGLLMKKTLSLSSLAVSSMSSAPADTDRASTSVGVCLPSGTMRRNPRVFDNVRSFATLAVKKCANSGSLLGIVCDGSCVDASSAVISSTGLWYCSVADR